jgi:uncharacterized protein (DUF2147 family)
MMARYMCKAMPIALALGLANAAAALAAGDPNSGIVGVWQTPEKSQVTITVCPQDYCGNLTKIVVPPEELAKLTPEQRALVAKMDPSQFPDARNQDPALRTRTLLGVQLFAVHPADAATFKGQLYNPQDGKNYDGYVKIIDANTIEVGGCVMNYCGNPIPHQEWSRAPEEDQAAAAVTATPAKAKRKAPAADATDASDPGGF